MRRTIPTSDGCTWQASGWHIQCGGDYAYLVSSHFVISDVECDRWNDWPISSCDVDRYHANNRTVKRAKKDTIYSEMCVYSSVIGSVKHFGGDIANIVQHLVTKENHFEMIFEVGKTII